MRKQQELLIQCPFYHRDEGMSRIVCEGVVEGSTIHQVYRRKEDFAIQLEVFCCKYYKKCEIYRMLMEKYDG